MKGNKAIIITTIWIIFVTVFLYTVLVHTFEKESNPQYIKNNEDGIVIKSETKSSIKYKIEDSAGNYLYSWTFDKSKDGKNNIEDEVDLLIETDVINPKIDRITNTDDLLVVSFSHHGSLPSTSKIELDVSSRYNDGDKLYLYYFNEENNNIEYIDDNIVVKNGYADFDIKHCSEYILTENKIENAVGSPLVKKSILFYIMIGVIIFSSIKTILFKGK